MKIRLILLFGALVVGGATLAIADAKPAKTVLKQLDRTTPTGMIKLAGGAFRMGCSPRDKFCNTDEKPAHQVQLNGFWMDAKLVTQEAFQATMGKNPSAVACPTCPVDDVIWQEARDYCAKVGKRLPTEAEWEYAARGGRRTPRYGEIDAIAWSAGNSGEKTHPVAQKAPNKYGLYDMFGNVWEWCADWYSDEYYATSPIENPRGPENGAERVLRGGSFRFPPKVLRASFRTGFNPFYRYDDIGFRCARDL